MLNTKAIIERVREVNMQYQHLELAVDAALLNVKPGQSLLVRANEESWHPYLREQWWPINVAQGRLLVERPTHQVYTPGQIIDVIGLVGQPYRFRRTLRNVMLLAYDTPPTPLLMNIPWLLGNQVSVTLVLLGTATEYQTQHLPAEVEVLHGGKIGPSTPEQKLDQELTWQNQVLTVGWADQVFMVAAQDDEASRFFKLWTVFRKLRNEIPKQYLIGVAQPPLACGVGACSCCYLAMPSGPKLACMEGPAVDLASMDYKL
jgi:hypothetical protein